LALDFAKNAQSLGARGVTVESLEALVQAVEESRKHRVPTIIHVPTDPDHRTGAYDAWWRVDVAAVSSDGATAEAYQENLRRRQTGHRYQAEAGPGPTGTSGTKDEDKKGG
jgi:3D-(3,5/4)-trihydroxycyclohexane-1,2-dione acylhydrolase (decyclizing)